MKVYWSVNSAMLQVSRKGLWVNSVPSQLGPQSTRSPVNSVPSQLGPKFNSVRMVDWWEAETKITDVLWLGLWNRTSVHQSSEYIQCLNSAPFVFIFNICLFHFWKLPNLCWAINYNWKTMCSNVSLLASRVLFSLWLSTTTLIDNWILLIF